MNLAPTSAAISYESPSTKVSWGTLCEFFWKRPVATTIEMSLPTLLRPAAIMPLVNLLVNVYATGRARPLPYMELMLSDKQWVCIVPLSPPGRPEGGLKPTITRPWRTSLRVLWRRGKGSPRGCWWRVPQKD